MSYADIQDNIQDGGFELDRVGAAYLAHLTDADLRALVHAAEAPAEVTAGRIAALRREPSLLLDLLDRPATTENLLALADRRAAARFSFISPFLVFAAAVHRTAADLAASSYALERAAPRMRVPLFDSADLAAYLAVPRRRLALAQLLASYARVSSGVAVTRTARGVRRRRWDDLDPARLAVLLEALPEAQRPGVWRRLGDLALFLAGVFPDAAGRGGRRSLDGPRLARLTGVRELPRLDLREAELMEWLGSRWYRLAAERAVAPLIGFVPAGRQPAGHVPAGREPAGHAAADLATHFRQARRVLNAATDRYLFPVTTEWFGAA